MCALVCFDAPAIYCTANMLIGGASLAWVCTYFALVQECIDTRPSTLLVPTNWLRRNILPTQANHRSYAKTPGSTQRALFCFQRCTT